MCYKEIMHVCRMLFFLSQNLFQHNPCRRVLVCEIADQFARVLNRDPFSDQVLLDHVNQLIRLAIFGIGTRGQSGRVHVGDTAKLVNPIVFSASPS
ncbi:hypothetical protein AAJCM20276_19860 [Acetobacter aceti]|uniref:Uncharacterized protein n=1 Tax=Acetobacter aceti TaxID=435 RepID=A0A6S6PRP4_ACEAC|nr:hypothetical protein AAJCM20276_19860 [Acetobacter aceti]